jgi:anti-sigma B factor antagonist
MPASFSIDELPEAWVLTARGELDYADNAAFRSCIESVLAGGPDAIVVDMSDIHYLDSSGLGLLLRLHREYGAESGRLVLVPSESVRGVLEITRLTNLFATSPDVAAAISSLKHPAA